MIQFYQLYLITCFHLLCWFWDLDYIFVRKMSVSYVAYTVKNTNFGHFKCLLFSSPS